MRSPPVSIWLAAAFAGSILVWGFSQISNLVRHGDINMFYVFLTLNAFLFGLMGFWAMRWWGLALTACSALYVSMFSPIGNDLRTIATMIVFFAPLAVVAYVNRSRFKW